jgi:hypothetical protein
MVNREKVFDAVALEAMVDHHGLSGVLTMLSDICNEKAEHIRDNWQDKVFAKAWDRYGRRIEALSNNIES